MYIGMYVCVNMSVTVCLFWYLCVWVYVSKCVCVSVCIIVYVYFLPSLLVVILVRVGGGLFACPYPLKVQARPPRDQNRLSGLGVGARRNSVIRAFAHGAMGRRIDPS